MPITIVIWLLSHSRTVEARMVAYQTVFVCIALAFCCNHMTNCDAKLVFQDLSYTYNNETLYWPSMVSDRFRFVKDVGRVSPYYSAYTFYTAEHGGTHMDAPSHFVKGKQTADQVPLSSLIGKAVVIDVTKKAMVNKDLLIGQREFEEHEKTNGKILDNSIILLYSGWGKYWPNATAYFGTPGNDTSMLHFPGLDPNGATWLIQNRKIKAIGIDTASIDYGQSSNFQSHVNLMQQNIPVFENVANLHMIPTTGAMVYAMPMKIGGGSGGPLRIIATWDTRLNAGSTAGRLQLTFIPIIVLIAVAFCNMEYY